MDTVGPMNSGSEWSTKKRREFPRRLGFCCLFKDLKGTYSICSVANEPLPFRQTTENLQWVWLLLKLDGKGGSLENCNFAPKIISQESWNGWRKLKWSFSRCPLENGYFYLKVQSEWNIESGKKKGESLWQQRWKNKRWQKNHQIIDDL